MNELDYNFIKAQVEKRESEMQSMWDKIADGNEEFRNAVLSLPEQINALNQKIENEQVERKASDKRAELKTNISIFIMILTLIVTLITGIFQTKQKQEFQYTPPTEVSDQS